MTADVTPRPLGTTYICRKVKLYANPNSEAVVVAQGQPASSGFPIPQRQEDGSTDMLELEVNDINLVYVAATGIAGVAIIYWIAER